jgi:hypothetical protein
VKPLSAAAGSGGWSWQDRCYASGETEVPATIEKLLRALIGAELTAIFPSASQALFSGKISLS